MNPAQTPPADHRDYPQTTGFFAMTCAWMLMLISYDFWLVMKEGKADDLGVIIFWSALFMGLAWAIFIVLPLRLLKPSMRIFSPLIFPVVTCAYGAGVYTLLIMSLFRDFDVVKMFFIPAAAAGFFFGLVYVWVKNASWWKRWMNGGFWKRGLMWISPLLFVLFFLRFLPAVFPSQSFRFMPDFIQCDIVEETLEKYKAGDAFHDLDAALPGYFEYFGNGEGNMMASLDGFQFWLEVKNDTIVRLDVKRYDIVP